MTFFASREGLLTVLALVAAGLPPLLIVVGSAGLAPMPTLFWAVLVPAGLVFFAILLYARAAGLARLHRRLWIGLLGGIVLTMALDVVRSAGVQLGYLGDSISLFGRMITGAAMQAEPTPTMYLLGLIYHFANGVAFAVVYLIVFGRTRWWGAVLYSVLFVEVGMMALPPMAKMQGAFGIGKYGTIWNPMFFDTLLAHVAMGVALGIIVQEWARYPGVLFAEGRRSETPVRATRERRAA